MEAIGVIRRVDIMGRFVVPKELRKRLGIVESETYLEMFVDGGNIVLEKYQPKCIFCSGTERVAKFRGKMVCKNCNKELTNKITSKTQNSK